MTEDKSDPPSPSSPSSSSPPLDLSLVRAFGALEAALTDVTTATQNNTSAVQRLLPQISDLFKLLKERHKIDDSHKEAVLDALVKLTDSFDQLASREGAAVGAAVDARNALIAARDQINQGFLEVKKKITGQYEKYDEDGMPPVLHKIADFMWPIAMRNRAGIVKIVMGMSGFAGLIKLLHYYVTGQHL